MFNRHLELKLVKNTKPSNNTYEKTTNLSKEEFKQTAKDLTKMFAVTIVAVVGVSVILNTLGEIAIAAAESNFNSNN